MTALKQSAKSWREQVMNIRSKYNFSAICFFLSAVCMALTGCSKSAMYSKQIGFASSDQAANAFVKAVRENNNHELLKIFGPEAKELIWSGDKVRDQQRREAFLKAYYEQHRIESQGNKWVLVVGKNDWPFPIPIIQENSKWVFDTESGKEEILNRRIGRDELDTIQTMLAIVDAQREYAMRDPDYDKIHVYAQKFQSDPGKKNGLYWETKPGEEPSPLGPLVAQAREQGYFKNTSSEPVPYHGYYFKMLTAQGLHAQGGEYNYIVDGKMYGGFAVIAYPAEYGNSGIMTFIVNNDGVVYQKDLGRDTEQIAMAMKLFDPDETWTRVASD